MSALVAAVVVLIGWLGRRQEATTWARLKHHLEA
jgi:hypothetical protein